MTSLAEVAPAVVYRFDRFELLPASEELRKRGTRIHLPPQPFRVLLLLIERAGVIVTREDIHSALWGSTTFVDYEQGINTAIRRIRFALNDSAESPRFLQTLPRRGYCFIAPVERLYVDDVQVPAPPLRVVDENPDPVVDEARPPTRRRGWLHAALTGAMLLLTAAPNRDAATPAANPSKILRVAIAPMDLDRSRPSHIDPRQLSDELQTHLGLFQAQRFELVDVASAADVRIETALQEMDGALRVNARIVEPRTGRQVWAETMNRRVDDVRDFPREIALRTTRAFAQAYVPAGRKEPLVRTSVSPRALELYRQARAMRFLAMPQRDLDRALELFHQAVALEPRFAEAWSGIGDIWAERTLLWTGKSQAESYQQARAALQKAIALDPLCAEAHNDYARLIIQYERAYAAAEEGLRRAIALDPDYVDAHFNLALLLAAMGQHEKAVAEFRRVQWLDPENQIPSTHLAFFYLMAHRPDDALAEYQATLRAQRNPELSRWGLMSAAIVGRRWKEASHALGLVLNAPVEARNGDSNPAATFREQLLRIEAGLVAREKAGRVDPYVLACFYAQARRPDQAFEALDRAIAGHSFLAIYSYVDPRLEELRSDRRFAERLEKLGLK